MKTKQKYGQSFGIAAVSFAILDDGKPGKPVGYSEIPGTLEVSGISSEVVTTVGGFKNTPQYARAGAKSGEAKLSLNECPSWLERIAVGGRFATESTDVANANATISAVQPVSPADAATNTVDVITVAATAGEIPLAGSYWLEATDERTVTITAHTEKGQFVFAGVQEDTGNVLADVGLTLSTFSALTTGHVARVDVLPPHKGRSIVTVDGNPEHQEYMVKAWSVARRSPHDNLLEVTLGRVMVHGYSDKMEHNVAPNGVEFSLQMMDPEDGRKFFTKEHLVI